ncbi:MAG: SRPBCC family protein [Chthoniobacterales bacterium]
MAIYTFTRAQKVPRPIEECWAFFSNPANLAQITPPALGFTVKSELPAQIHRGLMIRYTVSPLGGIPLTWLTEITQMRAPEYFVDEQRVGPYRVWHHEHFFRALSPRETEVRDLVHYVPPFGFLGAIMNRLVIARQLAEIFDFREAQLLRLFGPATGEGPDSRA